MRIEHVESGLRELLGGQPVLDVPDDTGQPWLAVKYGAQPGDVNGVVRARVGDRSVIVKVNPARGIGQTLIPWIIEQYDIALPRPYPEFAAAAETSDTGDREPAVYRLPAVQESLPRELGRFRSDGQTALVLEDLGRIDGLDPGGAIARWPTDRIEQALVAAARFHAATAGHEFPWTIGRPTTATVWADRALWRSQLEDAARRFPEVVTPQVLSTRLHTIEAIRAWHPAKDAMPSCLVHNDFNQRNSGFRDSAEVVVLDWELARVNIPQRDVVELLTFMLDEDVSWAEVRHLLAVHRQALADHGMPVEAAVYDSAAAAEFRVQSFDRIGMQLVFGAAFDLPYLARVNRTVDRLVTLTGAWAG